MTLEASSEGRRVSAGRPRDTRATEEILKAALELGTEAGFDAITIEGIAARAGVGKATIYRRWRSVWSIVADAVLTDVVRVAPLQERGSARESLRESMRLAAHYFRSARGQVLRALIGRAQVDEPLRKALIDQWLITRRQITRGFIRQGMASGELRPDLDPDIVLDALYGPLYHRLLLPYDGDGGDLSETYIDTLLDTVFDGLMPRCRPEVNEPLADGPLSAR